MWATGRGAFKPAISDGRRIYLNGYSSADPTYVPPGWDTWAAFSGGEKYYRYRLNVNGTLVSYGAAAQDYSTDVLTNRALNDYWRSIDARLR